MQGELALGLGRESVSGVLPLFLFREHWEIAKCKLQPLFGFMCTLDPMGYTMSQLFTIPFLVLNKAMEDVQEKPTESNQRILMYVLNTCVQLVGQNESLKRQIIEQANAFAKFPESRTADAVASIQVLIAQVISLLELPQADQVIKNTDPQSNQGDLKLEIDIKSFCQAAVEEVMRRMQKKDAQPLSKA